MEPTVNRRRQYVIPSLGWLAVAFAGSALFLVPWALWLSRSLPSTYSARHWDLAWAGFDGALAIALGLTTLSAVKHSPWLVAAASSTATLLIVDAWFDVLTARGGSELATALLEATLVELPLAALCLWIVRDTERAIQRLCDCFRLRRPRAAE